VFVFIQMYASYGIYWYMYKSLFPISYEETEQSLVREHSISYYEDDIT